ncbi:ead/Ea22-like family protein [Enterobacter roggenkampii]|nr:ead/Ea22-like family protein [Enterobacter roggenkampii]
MSNIDKRALREAAEKALNAQARLALMESVFDDDGDDVKPEAQEDISICVSFNDLTNPATVLALLDELEATEKRIAQLDA